LKRFGEIALLLIGMCVFVPFGLAVVFWVYSLNSIVETTKPEFLRKIGSRYTRYADLDEVKQLKWATGMYTSCIYTRLTWSGVNGFAVSDSTDQAGRDGLQLNDNEVWYPISGRWDRGPIDTRQPSAYHTGQVSKCNTSKFGRVSNAYKKIFEEDVWFVDTRSSLIVISNKDKTIEFLSEAD